MEGEIGIRRREGTREGGRGGIPGIWGEKRAPETYLEAKEVDRE